MSITRVLDLLALYRSRYRKPDVLAAKRGGVWETVSSADFVRHADEVSLGLLGMGIRKGDKLGLMSPNCPEWNFVDFGIMQIGAVTVPLYPTMSLHDLEYIFRDAGIKALFVAGPALYERIKPLRAVIPEVEVFSFEPVEEARSWEEVRSMGRGKDAAALESVRQQVLPDDLLTLIYTSGTTGSPKGVMLTHRNLVSNILACQALFPENVRKALSFLPLCHIFERMVCYLYLSRGISVYYAENMESIPANILETGPDAFTTVPRLLEKVYDRIVARGQALTGLKKALFFWALRLGLDYEQGPAKGPWYRIQLKIANKLVFRKWREGLGGNIKVITSGGAALQPRLAKVFNAAGIPVLQGYGLTETSPVISVNRFGRGNHKLGSVGRPIDGVEVKIAPDGEILCRGENVMAGYYKRPEATAAEIDGAGWFHTGDTGRLDEDGFLFITGRKKEMFKTAGGKYVIPAVLENKFKESPFIEHITVVGENRRFPAALVVPSFPYLKEWCARHGIAYTTNVEMVKDPAVLARYEREKEKYNAPFGHWEQIKKIVLLPVEWSIEGGELTPKLDARRSVILERNASLIDKIYENAAGNQL